MGSDFRRLPSRLQWKISIANRTVIRNNRTQLPMIPVNTTPTSNVCVTLSKYIDTLQVLIGNALYKSTHSVTHYGCHGTAQNSYHCHSRVPTPLVTKNSRTFQAPRSIFPGIAASNIMTYCTAVTLTVVRHTLHFSAIGTYCAGTNHVQQLNMLDQLYCKQWLQYPDVLYGIQVYLASAFASLRSPSESLPEKFQEQTHFPGLSRFWKFYKRNSRTFQEAQEPCQRSVREMVISILRPLNPQLDIS